MQHQKSYTHKELARLLKISETTVKSYRRKFPCCIPVSSEGKPIHFTEEALAVCKKIKEHFLRGMSVPEVRLRLAGEFDFIAKLGLDQSFAGLEKSAAAAHSEERPLAPQEDEGEEKNPLPAAFNTALANLAKSVVTLTRQQANILERLEALEKNIADGNLPREENNFSPASGKFSSTTQGEGAEVGAAYSPELAEELASTLTGAILKTFAAQAELAEARFGKGAPLSAPEEMSDDGIEDPPHAHVHAHVHAQGHAPYSESYGSLAEKAAGNKEIAESEDSSTYDMGMSSSPSAGSTQETAESGRSPAKEEPPSENRPSGVEIGDDFFRNLASLPLVARSGESYAGLAGRNPFSVNDIKAVLAQVFSPPHHYVFKWETLGHEYWFAMVRSATSSSGGNMRLQVRPIRGLRSGQMVLELLAFVLDDEQLHPLSLYKYVQEQLKSH